MHSRNWWAQPTLHQNSSVTWPSLRAPTRCQVRTSTVLVTNRTEPSPSTAFTPLGCRLRAGITPLVQSCEPPGQQAPPAEGYCQLGGAAVVSDECPAAYQAQL